MSECSFRLEKARMVQHWALKNPPGWFLGLLSQQPTCGVVCPCILRHILSNDNCLMPVPVPPALPWPSLSPSTCPEPVHHCGRGTIPFSQPSEVVMISSCSGWAPRKQAPISRLLSLFLVWCAELVLFSQSFSQVSWIPAQGSSKTSASLSCVCVCIHTCECAEHLNAIFYLVRSEPWYVPVVRHWKSVWSWCYNFLTKPTEKHFHLLCSLPKAFKCMLSENILVYNYQDNQLSQKSS